MDKLVRKKEPIGKREMKRLEKEKQMIYLRTVEGMPPREIAKKLRVSVQDVYKAEQRVKVNLQKAKAVKADDADILQVEFFQQRLPPRHDSRVIDEVGRFL